MSTYSRRQVLALGIAGAGALLIAGPATTATAQETRWSGARSANGWPVVGPPAAQPVEGSDLTLAVLPGPVATLLLHCVRRYLYEIDATVAQAELVGHRTDRTVAAPFESNHLSGTAVAVRPGFYPLGATGGLFPHEALVIRDVLAECDGLVRWGQDLEPVKESHFQIDVAPGDPRLALVAARLGGGVDPAPTLGAGVLIDPLDPARRPRAQRLEGRQRPR